MISENKSISIVIPLFNEENSIHTLVEQIKTVVEKNNISNYEVLIIDDGSTDKSWEKINDICKTNKFIKGFQLRKNFGKSIALNIGFKKFKMILSSHWMQIFKMIQMKFLSL